MIVAMVSNCLGAGWWGIYYSDVIMSAIAFQITGVWIVFSTVRSGADQRKHQSFTSLAFVRGIHRWHKGSVTREMIPFDDVIMNNTIFNHFVNHKLLHNEKSVLRWNTVVHESSQCKYMCSRAIAHWVFWSWRNWQSNHRMSLIPTQLSWRKWNNVTEIFHLQCELQTPKYSISIPNVYGPVWCIFVNIISPPTRFGQYQNYHNVKRYAYRNLVVSKQCLLDVLDIIIHWRNMRDMCPRPLQIR